MTYYASDVSGNGALAGLILATPLQVGLALTQAKRPVQGWVT